MAINEVEVKQKKIVEEPRLSLTQFARYPASTANARETILFRSKYPGGYIPKYYLIARKIIADTFSANFDDYELYFEEFQRHSKRLKKEASAFSPKTDDYKNRFYSATALDNLVRMSDKIIPILKKYVLNSNVKNTRHSIEVRGVKIGAMSDMLLFDQIGNQIGLLKFNFPQAKLKGNEVDLSLKVLRTFFKDHKGLNFSAKHCIFIDFHSGKIFVDAEKPGIGSLLDNICIEIKSVWKAI